MLKREITAAVVTCLVREQAPEYEGPVVPVEVDGWDNSSFRVGDSYLARLPTDDGYVPAVAKEHEWLPVLAAQLPIAVPEPLFRGAPGCGFPRPWSLYRWLPGRPATREEVRDLQLFASDVAAFLVSLRQVDATDGPLAGEHSFGRGGPLEVYDDDVHACLPYLPPDVNSDQVVDRWRQAVAAPYCGERVWFHGDMSPSNLLVHNGRLSAAIDFGTCGVGDPACDLVLAWTFLDDPSGVTFREAVQVDDATWLRGQAWALWKALLTLRDDDPSASTQRYGWRHDADDVVRRVLKST